MFLGDYIDRGSDSRGCVDAILEFREEARAEVVCLRGNHEDWLLRTMHDYRCHSWLIGMEGLDTIRCYSPQAAVDIGAAMREAGLAFYLDRCTLPYELFFRAVPESHRAFFSELAVFFETPDCMSSHAGVDPAVTVLAEQSHEALVWGCRGFPDEYDGLVPIVYGHWNDAELDASGWPHPRLRGNTIGVDTIALVC